MSDMLDDALAAFDAHVGLEADEQGAPDEGGTPAPEEPGIAEQQPEEGQLRDEHGRFASPEQTPAAAAEEPAVAAEEADAKFASYLARFGATPDSLADLPPEVQETIKAGFEADRTLGRRGQEYGELKKELEQLRAQLAPQEPQPAEEQPYYNPDELTAWFDQNPMQIPYVAAEAHQSGDVMLRDAAIEAWAEHDKLAAKQFERAVLRDEIATDLATWTQTQTADRDQVVAAWAKAQELVPDIAEHAQAIIQAAHASPEVLAGFVEGGVEEKARVFATLYKLAQFDARQADTLLEGASQEAQARQAEEARAEKKQAFVGSGSKRNEPAPKSADEEWLERYFDPAAEKYYARD